MILSPAIQQTRNQLADNNTMHTKPDLRVRISNEITRSGSVIIAVMPLGDMVLSCDITIDGDRHAEFVLFPNALYVSPDETVASVSSVLAWCNKCGGFCAAERIDTEKATRDQLNKSLDDDLPDFHDFIFENDPHAIEKFRDSLRRTLHWRTLRKAPPSAWAAAALISK